MMTKLTWAVSLFYLLLAALFLLDVTNSVNQMSVQSRHRKILQGEISTASREAKQTSSTKLVPLKQFDNEADAAGEVLRIARLSHLEVSAMRTEVNHSANHNALTFHLTALGGLAETFHFVALMAENHLVFQVDHFSLVKSPQSTVIELDLSVFRFYFADDRNKSELLVQDWQDPFADAVTNQNDHDNMLHSTSITQLQFAGYLQQAGSMVGIVMLPNGESFSVSNGDKIGTENAVVTNVSSQGIRVLNNNEEKWIENKNWLNDVVH